jgi:elongation factor Ts
MSFTANDVKTLRDRTNAPLMECKAALTESGGDIEKAIEGLRKKAGSKIGNFAARETAEGRVAAYLDHAAKVGAIVEVRCETAPVAKTDQFIQLAGDIAKQVAVKNPASVDALLAEPFVGDASKKISDRIMDVFQIIRENMRPHRFVRFEGLVGEYVHHDGSIGVLLLVDGEKADPQLLRDVCMHIAARGPLAARKEDVPADVLQKEMEIAKAQIANDPKNSSKPANILEKIIEGKMKTWLADNVLVEQPFVKDDTKTVGQLLKEHGLTMNRFVRYKIGEIK